MLESLTIANWKAFGREQFNFSPGVNFFTGENGSGKTSVLEAISVALTGRAVTADLRHLVREASHECRIQLDFRVGDTAYSARRRFSRERLLGSELTINGQSIGSSTWEDVTAAISRALKTDPTVFPRLIYMPEGEVFAYLTASPQDALDKVVRRTFGLERFQELIEYFRTAQREYEKRAGSLRADLAKPTVVSSVSVDDAKSEIIRLESEIASAEAELKLIDTVELNAKSQRLRSVERLIQEFQAEAPQLGYQFKGPDSLRRQVEATVGAAREALDAEDQQAEESARMRGALAHQFESLGRVRTLLTEVAKAVADHSIPCPVCKRPIDSEMARSLLGESAGELERAESELGTLDKRLEQAKVRNRAHRQAFERLGTVQTQILSMLPSDDITLADLTSELNRSDALLQQAQQTFEAKQQAVRRLTSELDNARVELGRAETIASGVPSQDALKRRLVQAYKGAIVASVAGQALEHVAKEQRDVLLAPMYNNLAEIWKQCRPERDWEVNVDEKGRLKVRHDGHWIEFAQLSGGEKTVLLVLTRVLMSAMFSDADFLMIDEPLEHLDIRNRRSLINFVVASATNGLVPQVLITTFEESLVRKFLDSPNINTKYLHR